MGRSCVILGCASRAERDTKRFFRIPAVISRQGDNILKLSTERRRLWLQAINRQDYTPTRYHCYVCSDHFVGGQPAGLMQRDDPDWIPSVKLNRLPGSRTYSRRPVKDSLCDFTNTLPESLPEPELRDPLDTTDDSAWYPTVCVKTEITSEDSNTADALVANKGYLQDLDCTGTCSHGGEDQRPEHDGRENEELLGRISQLERALLESQRVSEDLVDKLNWAQKELQARQSRIEELQILLHIKV